MQSGSRERHPRSNKYDVAVSRSSSPNRRVLVAILLAITLVVVVGLATFIPIYVTSKGRDQSADEKEIKQQSDEDFNTKLSKRSVVTHHSKPRSSCSPVLYSSPSQSTPEISATSSPRSSSSTADISLRVTSSLMTSHSSSSVQEAKSYLASSSASSSGKMISKASESTAGIKTLVSSFPDFEKASATVASAASHLYTTPASTAKTIVTLSLQNQVTTSSMVSTKTIPSTSAILRQDHPSLLSSMGSLDAVRNSVSPIMSSISEVHSTSRVADLTVIANLEPNTESKWSRWSPWSDCTKTCGSGTRYRNRTCVAINQEAVFVPVSCAGKSSQARSCSAWSCPDCSRNCTTGTLNAACDACTCDHHVLTGRVLTIDNAPLSEANLSLAQTPYKILAQTNASGHFMTLGVCADEQELLIQKPGFVPVTKKANVLTPTTASITVKLEFAVAPSVTVHPKSKIRMAGQPVTFCCDGEGNPPPEVEWFKENNVIDKDLYNYNNTLEISDVTGLNGSFRCRVINQFGSEFSKVAELKVSARSEDSCSSVPISKNQTLPPGCVLNGTNITVLDVGECVRVACVKGNDTFNSSCSDPQYCCEPLSFNNLLVKCGAIITFTLPKIKTCGCGKCIHEKTNIQGHTVGQDGEAAKFVDLFYNGKQVDRTNAGGMFSFSVPRDTKRAIVTFKDQLFKKFQEEDKIFSMTEGQKAIYKVVLREKPQSFIFNASEPLDLPLGGDSNSFANLELPENTLLTEDGSVFRGNAKASLSVTDPRNLSDILTAPGDFTTVSEDGDEEILETYGMIKLNMEDDKGKPLVMSKSMKVYLDPEKLNLSVSEGNASVKLYWLDRKTGRWRETGDFSLEDGSKRRRKRTNRVFLVGTVTPSITQENLNFDMPAKRVGLRVTVSSQEDNVIITAIRKDYKGYVQRITNKGVVCMVIWKDKDYYLQARKDFKYYDPDENIVTRIQHVQGRIVSTEGDGETIGSFKFHSALVNPRGPIYYDDTRSGGRERQMCEMPLNDANRPGIGRQFVFKPHEDATPEYALLSAPGFPQWFSADAEICFIKVKITGSNTLFMVTSYNKDAQTVIGFHIRMSKSVTSGSGSVSCFQFRCPRDNDHTVVRLTPMTSGATCRYDNIDTLLSDAQSDQTLCPNGPLPTAAGQEKWLCIPFKQTDKFSTFSGFSKENGEAKCLRNHQAYGGVDISSVISSDGSSVQYTCS